MPTPLNPNEKNNFIAIVQAAPFPGGAEEAGRLESILNNYEDIYTAIMRELQLFATNNAYLTQGMACFDDTQLQAVGIWNNKTISSPPLTDPVLIINSTINDLVIISPSSPPVEQNLVILGNSNISRIVLLDYTQLTQIWIGPSVIVDAVDSSYNLAEINTITLPFLRSTPSRLNSAVYGSNIKEVVIAPGSYYGGQTNDDPDAMCAEPVTNLDVAYFTRNTVQLTWTPPDPYLFINTYYRTRGSNTWILATEDVGYFNGETGFTFTQLEKGTVYEMEVITTCVNGGLSTPVTIGIDTTCCSASPP